MSVEEKIVLDLERDGGIKKLEVTTQFMYSSSGQCSLAHCCCVASDQGRAEAGDMGP